MDRFDQANETLNNRDWTGARVDQQPRKTSIIHSVRMSPELTERLVAEAERRDVTPSEVIRDLVDAGLRAAEQSPTVRLADVHRALDALGRTPA